MEEKNESNSSLFFLSYPSHFGLASLTIHENLSPLLAAKMIDSATTVE